MGIQRQWIFFYELFLGGSAYFTAVGGHSLLERGLSSSRLYSWRFLSGTFRLEETLQRLTILQGY